MASDMVDAVLTQPQQAPQNPQTPDAVDSVLQVAPQIKNLSTDPAEQSGQLHAAVMAARGEVVDDNKKLALVQAYQSLYGQRGMEQAGGNADLQNQLQMQAATNTPVGNFFRAGANAFAQTGANVVGIVDPEDANAMGQRADEEYNPDMQRASGKAGEFVGNTIATAPAVLAPGAAVPVFAGLGFGQANRDVSQRNANGQDIGMGQRLAYAGSEAAIQGLVAHFLGEMTGGGLAQGEDGALTQTLPLQGMIRKLSPDLLKSIQGTDGAIIRPIIQRTLLNAGVAAGQNEVAMIASEIAKSAIGIVGDKDDDLVDRILKQTPDTLLQGAAQGALFHGASELGTNGEMSRGTAEEVPQENIQKLGTSGGDSTPRQVRYASDNPFDETDEEKQTPPTAGAAPTATTPEPTPDSTDSAQLLPAEFKTPVQENDELQQFVDYQKQQIKESDDLLAGRNKPMGNGQLPNDYNFDTNAPEHPLVKIIQSIEPSARGVPVPENLKADFAALDNHGITAVAMQGEHLPEGMSHPDHPDSVLIDVSNPKKSFWNVLAHEAGHVFQYNNPERAAALYDQIPEPIKRQYKNDYFRRMKRYMGADKAYDYLAKYGRDEVISMAMGDAAQKSGLVRRAFKGDEGTWNDIKDAFARTLNKFTGKGRMLNAIADEMREGLGMKREEVAAAKPTPSRGVQRVKDEAKGYAEKAGLPYSEFTQRPHDTAKAKRIADAYGQLEHNPNDPAVKASYDAFKKETLDQFNYLKDQGVKFEPHSGEGQPYANSRDMMKDVSENKHLSFFTGGELPKDHPLAEKVPGSDLTYNDVFRAVHDYFGHAKEGNQFGPRGEESAWRVHAALYSKEAQPAMTTETRGQNSFVNYGPNGEHNRAKPAETIFAPQKAGILPTEFHPDDAGQQAPAVTKHYLNVGHNFRRDGSEELWWKDEEGNLNQSPVKYGSDTHVHAGADEAEIRGRIDHKTQEISMAAKEGVPEREIEYTAKQMQKKFKDYTVYVPGKGGMVPLEELASHSRFMLEKLDNIANDEEDGEAYKAAMNAKTPANAIKFETTAEDKIKKQVLDSQAPLVNMIRTAMSRVNDPSKLSPEAYLRRMFGFRERRYQQETKGLRSLAGEELVDKTTGENLTRQWLVDPLMKYAKQTGENEKDVKAHAQSVMVAQRTLEKAALRIAKGGTNDAAISGIGRGKGHGGTEGEQDVAEARDFLAKSGQDKAAMDMATEYARRLRLWGNEHLSMAVESGLVSKKAAREMQNENEFYVNMQRVMENKGLLGEGDFSDGKYHRFRGSNRMIDDPLANTLQSTEQIAKKAEMNFTKQKIMELVKPFGDMVQPAKNVQGANAPSDRNTISVMEDGVEKKYYVDPQVASVINGWGQHVPPVLWGALSIPGKLKAWGTLLRPMFRWNHFRKQLQNRLLVSEEAGGVGGIKATLKGFDSDTKELLDVLGGTMSHERDYGSSSGDYHKIISKLMDGASKDSNVLLALPRKVWNGYQKLGEWSDAFNRVVEYKGAFANAKRRGMNDLEAQTYAAWKARDLMDFSVAGEAVKQVNRIAYQPFLNAELQGFRKIYDLARTNPTLAAQRLAVFGLLPSMIPYLWAKSQGKETEARYKDTPLAQRIGFYQFHVGNYRMMIPKGQTQAMASALWEAYLDKHNGDVGTWARAMGDSGLIPRPLMDPESVLPFQGVREAISNYSWFFDKHIIPPDQEGLAMDLRHTDGASGLAKTLGTVAKTAGWELDPRKIDHVLDNDFGTIGIDAENASNIHRPDKPLGSVSALSYADTRLEPGYTSVSVQDAMNAANRYRDTSSPQYKQMSEALSASYRAPTVEERNKLVDDARAAADAANDFYKKHGDEMLAAKEASGQITAAVQEGQQQVGADAKRKWAAANPDKLPLIRDEDRLRTLDTRIGELRKALVNPRLSPATKQRADAEITRLYSTIAKMVSDAH